MRIQYKTKFNNLCYKYQYSTLYKLVLVKIYYKNILRFIILMYEDMPHTNINYSNIVLRRNYFNGNN